MKPANVMLLLVAATMAGVTGAPMASGKGPQGVWLIEGQAAVQIDDCNGLLCGRLRWLQAPHDADGKLKRDKRNPDPAMRQRELCGLTLLWDLHSAGPGHWDDGQFYNPQSGKTYGMKMELTPFDALVARFYDGISLLGETKALSRILLGTSKGWC
jgi:uncharacterized protein (DUF2147 family)